MNRKYILHDRVLFLPAENKLTPLGVRGSEVILHAPVSRILLLLIQRQGMVVHQEEIFQEVWEKFGQRVAPNTLYQNVSLLRKALRKSGVPTLAIKTYPKAGFSYKGSVHFFDESGEPDNGQENKVNSAPVIDTKIFEIEGQEKNNNIGVGQSSNMNKRVNITSHVRPAVILALTLCFLFFIVPSSTDEKFTAEQEIVAIVNGCQVYVDRGNKKVELSRILLYLREREIKCIEHELLYLTKTPNKDEVMVLACNSDDRDFKCTRIMKLPLYLTPKPKE